MRNSALSILLLTLLAAGAAFAGDPPLKVVPQNFVWTVEGCETWDCAMRALNAANGDRNVIVIPSANPQHPWVVLRRVPSGAYYVPPEAPIRVEAFDSMEVCLARWACVRDGDGKALMLLAPDGKALVVYTDALGSRYRPAR